jgi:hypothetical protein
MIMGVLRVVERRLIYTPIYTYIHKHTHTHIHTYTHSYIHTYRHLHAHSIHSMIMGVLRVVERRLIILP